MSISLNANFELLSAGLYLDARQQFNTIIEMKDFAETSIPDGFITYNKETQKHYVFSSSNTVDVTLGKWREYNSGNSSSTTYATWNSNVDYKVGNVVLKDEVRYSCIADHTSTDFETDSINWVVILEQYYHVTQEQYNKMVSDGLITDGTKDLYIIDGNSEGGNSSVSYTSLDELGLTADATLEDVVNALKNGESFLAPVNTFTNYETIFPNKLPNDQWNKVHIIKGTSLASSHIRCFSQSGTCEYLPNVNNTNVLSWNDVSGRYIDISDSTIEKLGNEILKYPVGKYKINLSATGAKFTDLPSDAEIKCGIIEINGTDVNKSPFTDTWVYRMYKFECLIGTTSYVRRLNSGATVGQIEADTGWRKNAQQSQQIYTSLSQLGITTPCTIKDIWDKMPSGSITIVTADSLIVTDLDAIKIALEISNGDEVYGILTVVKLNGRTTLEFRNARTSSPMKPDTFVGYCKGDDCTSIRWTQEYNSYTTTVADVPKTTLTPVFPNGLMVGSGGATINYVVRNGWCNVDFVFNIKSATALTWNDIATGLPKPENSVNIVLINDGGKTFRPIPIKINSTGSVSLRVPTESSTTDWWTGNISYPVAE